MKYSGDERENLIRFYNENLKKYQDLGRYELAGAWIKQTNSDRTIDAVETKLRRLESNRDIVPFEVDGGQEFYLEDLEEKKFDELRVELNDWLGRTPVRRKRPEPNKKYEETLVLSDLHIPFCRWGKIFEAVDIAKDRGIERCWINGDVFEYRKFSRFKDKEKSFTGPDGKEYAMTLKNELKFNLWFKEYISSAFEIVHKMSGNHDDRPRKHFLSAGLSDELVELLVDRQEVILFGRKEFPNIITVETNIGGEQDVHFYGKIGDCLLTHMEVKTNRVPMKQVQSVDEWFKIYEEMDSNLKDIRLIIQGHSHRVGKFIGRYHRMVMEAPAMVTLMKYMVSGSPSQWAYPIPGYIILVQDEDGRTDINKTNFVLLEEGGN